MKKTTKRPSRKTTTNAYGETVNLHFRVFRAQEFGIRLDPDMWLGTPEPHVKIPEYFVRDGKLFARHEADYKLGLEESVDEICDVEPDLDWVDLTAHPIPKHADAWIAPKPIVKRLKELEDIVFNAYSEMEKLLKS